MLMSFYFGAGNLIYPPTLGLASGTNFPYAITTFIFSAICVPFLSLLAVALSGGTSLSFAGRVGKTYALVFTIIILLATGPLFAIPRVANVTYEIAIAPLLPTLPDGSTIPISSDFGIIFIGLFFFITFTLAMYGEQLLDTIGSVISPALIIFIVILIVAFLISDTQLHVNEPAADYTSPLSALSTGAVQGYQTLDAIASIIFANLIVQTFDDDPKASKKELLLKVVKAGVIACSLLGIIYLALGYLGNVTAGLAGESGPSILIYSATVGLGSHGKLVFAVIIFLACLTTAVGLAKVLSEYFFNLFGLMSEKMWLVVFTLSSAVFSVQGLNEVIRYSLPLIFFIYPIIIVLAILNLANKWTKDKAWMYIMVAITTTPVAFADAFKYFSANSLGNEIDLLAPLRDVVPFFNTDFTWVTPFIVGSLIGFFMPKRAVKEIELVDRNSQARKAKHDALAKSSDVIGY